MYFPNVTKQHIFQLMVPFIFSFLFLGIEKFGEILQKKKEKKLNLH
jgi:hypothetical protein